MNNASNLQQRINQLLDLANNAGLMAMLILGGILLFVFSFSENKRWWLITVWVFLLSLAKFLNSRGEWIAPPFPFSMIVTYGRTLGIVMTFALLPGAWHFYSRNRGSRIPPAAWAMFIFYMTYCVRFIPTSLSKEAASRAVIYSVIFFLLGMSLPRWITDRHQLLRSLQAAALSMVFLAVGSAISYVVSPATAAWNGRFFGLSSNPNLIGMPCALCMPVLFGLVAWKYENATRKLIWPIAAGIVMIVLLWTGSRGPMGVTAVGTIVFFRARLGNLIFVAVPLAASVWGLSLVLEDSFQNVSRFTNLTDTRTAGWQYFYSMWLKSPVLGNSDLAMAVTENSYLTILANAGLLGIAANLLLLGVWGTTCWKLWRLKIADRNGQILRDIALAGLISVMAAGVFEGIFLSVFSPTTFWIYYYCALAEAARKYSTMDIQGYQHLHANYFFVPAKQPLQ